MSFDQQVLTELSCREAYHIGDNDSNFKVGYKFPKWNRRYKIANIVKNGETGLNVMTIEDTTTGECAVVFEGSTGTMGTSKSWQQDDFNGLGLPVPQYDAAQQYVEAMKKKGYNITATAGDSLGGGDAAAVGIKYPDITAICVNAAPLDKGRITDGSKVYNNILQVRVNSEVLHLTTGAGNRDSIYDFPGQRLTINEDLFGDGTLGGFLKDVFLGHQGSGVGDEDDRPDLSTFAAFDLLTGAILDQASGLDAIGSSQHIKLTPGDLSTISTNLRKDTNNMLDALNGHFANVKNNLTTDQSTYRSRVSTLKQKLWDAYKDSFKSVVPGVLTVVLGPWIDELVLAIVADTEEFLNMCSFFNLGAMPNCLVHKYQIANDWLTANAQIIKNNHAIICDDIEQMSKTMDAIDHGQVAPTVQSKELSVLHTPPSDLPTDLISVQTKEFIKKEMDTAFDIYLGTVNFMVQGALLMAGAELTIELSPQIYIFLVTYDLVSKNWWQSVLDVGSIAVSSLQSIAGLVDGQGFQFPVIEVLQDRLGVSFSSLVTNVLKNFRPYIFNLFFAETSIGIVDNAFTQAADNANQQLLALKNCLDYLQNDTEGAASKSLIEKTQSSINTLQDYKNTLQGLAS